MMKLTAQRVQTLVDRFADVSVMIIGDLMLDQFVVGRVNRISPEAPVPVVEYDHDEYRAGGAANVAHNVRRLGGEVNLLGVVGTDSAGERLMRELRAQGVGTDSIAIDPSRHTTTKMRVVTNRNQQVVRIDYETDTEVEGEPESVLAEHIERGTRTAQVVVVSDYLKGTVTRRLMARVVAAGRERGVPVLVDPKIPHMDYYQGATLVTPNHHEAEVATHMRIRTLEEATKAAIVFRERAACEGVLITRGEQGMYLLDGSDGTHFQAVAREVSDVTGAGDTVIATLAVSLAAGATLAEAATLANHAAGVVVGKFGPATLTPTELVQAMGY